MTDPLATLCLNRPEWRADNTQPALIAFLQQLCEQLDLQEAYFLTTCRHPSGHNLDAQEVLDGWRVIDRVHHSDDPSVMEGRDQTYYEMALAAGGPDPLTTHAIRTAGTTRVLRRDDVVDDDTWNQHWIAQDYLARLGLSDRMLGIYSTHDMAEGIFVVSRDAGRPRFSQHDADQLGHAIQLPRPLLRWLMLERGLHAADSQPLTPRERELLPHLLASGSEKDIASAMGMTVGSVHTAIQRLYGKYNVSSRLGLMALWLAI